MNEKLYDTLQVGLDVATQKFPLGESQKAWYALAIMAVRCLIIIACGVARDAR